MKNFLAIILCVAMLLCFGACKDNGRDSTDDNGKGSTQDENNEQTSDTPSISYITQEDKQAWRKDLISLLSTLDKWIPEDTLYGSFGVGLMDIDLDGTPELFAASPGGSMGNVNIQIYGLHSAEEIAYYNAKHYLDSMNVNICHYADAEGNVITVATGFWRSPPSSMLEITEALDGKCEIENLFVIESLGEQKTYYYKNEVTSKQSFEQKLDDFESKYTELDTTRLKLIKWTDVSDIHDDKIAEKMADALIASGQDFIDFS